MPHFIPCRGKTACRDNGTHCETCGRSLMEIAWLRDLIEQMTSLSSEYAYDNVDEYCDYVAHKLKKSIAHRRGN